MNDRLEIASRLMAVTIDRGVKPGGVGYPSLPETVLKWADALIAEEARTRPPAADAPPTITKMRGPTLPAPDDLRRQTVAERALCGLKQLESDVEGSLKTGKTLVQIKGKPHLVPVKVADELTDLRAVAEAVTWALDLALLYGDYAHSDHAAEIASACTAILARASALGLGGGK